MSEPNPIETSGKAARPTWLVGPDLEIEPGLEGVSDRPRMPRVAEGGKPRRPTAPEPSGPATWTAAASSIPHLTVVPEGASAEPPSSLIEEEPGTVFPVDAEEALPHLERASPTLRPLHEPWWVVWSDALATDRRLQISIVVGLVVAGALFFVPRGRSSRVSIGEIKRHPERYEGRVVSVRGRVGEVFTVGQGYVFDLHQGRDTMVVFTHTRAPEIHDRIDVKGQVTTGYLDGRPRVALFEGEPAKTNGNPGP